MSTLLTMKSDKPMFGNFVDSVSMLILRRLRLAHPLKYFDVTLELRLADVFHYFTHKNPIVNSVRKNKV